MTTLSAREERIALMNKAKRNLINLLQNENYADEYVITRVDELTKAYQFQVTKAVEEGWI